MAALLIACSACSRKPPAPVAALSPAAEATVPELAGASPASDASAVAPSAPVDAATAPSDPPPASATLVAAARPPASDLPDPLQPLNRQLFRADRAMTALVDKTPMKRVAGHAPAPARSGLANFLQNLDEPQAAANHLLQRRPGGALKAAARFVINSTVGVAGLFDVAKKLGLQPSGASFSQTLASYGIKPGAYLYLPLNGPTSVRDVVGAVVDGYAWPVSWLKLGRLPLQAMNIARTGLERRQRDQAPSTALAAAKPAPRDSYLAVRTAYQDQLRAAAPARRAMSVSPSPSAPQTTLVAANP